MKIKYVIGIILILAASALALSGCGGGGGGGSAVTITLTTSKPIGLANGTDAVTVHASVTNLDGTPVADGTPVSFTAPDDNGNPAVTSTTAVSGLASVSLTRDPIQGANNQTETVTAASGGVSQSVQVKFINQPAFADVFINFNQAVENLAGLDFRLSNTAGATFDDAASPQPINTMNNAAIGGMAVVGNFFPDTNSTRIILASAAGFNTGTSPIIKATFAVAAGAATLPQFSVDLTSTTFSAVDAGLAPITTVTAANLAVTVTFDTE